MVHSSLKPAENFSISKLYLWRCIVAMAHADNMIREEEEEWLRRTFINMRDRAGMPADHYDTLLGDLEDKQDVANLLPYINEPKYRSQVVYFARLLAYKDGEMHPSEDALLEKLQAHVASNVDIEEIRKEVRYNVGQELVLHEARTDSGRPDSGLFGLVDQLALHFGIDLMDE